jgi:hypothetical protein
LETLNSMNLDGVLLTPSTSLPFEVEQNYDWLDFTISFSKKGWYSVLVWDPSKKLRAQSLLISEPKSIRIAAFPEETSFAAVSGEIQAGIWELEILSPTNSEQHIYTIQVNGGYGKSEKEAAVNDSWAAQGVENGFTLSGYVKDRMFHSKSRWYKGDFHTHTTESDGKMTVENGLKQAKEMKLDYFVATDHNILPTKWRSSEMMVIPGVEITSSQGHFNALGLTNWIDWRPTCADGGMETEIGMNRIIHEVKASGALVSINHPMLKPWQWQYLTTPLKEIDVIEIWNDPTYKDNPEATEKALRLWNILWNDGHCIFGIGGSDSHLLPTESYEEGGPPSVIGDPATYVFCNGLSPRTLLEGIKAGKAYVSRGPEYIVNIIVDGISYPPGSDLSECFNGKNEIHISYEVLPNNTPANARLIWVKDGKEIDSEEVFDGSIINKQFTIRREEVSWIRFEVRSKDGKLLSFINPIFTGAKTSTLSTWGDILSKADYLDYIRDEQTD